tara:strand:- start:1630 stop:2532 length:903 start_codon:yes stop_codon:yes gene_type:complete
MKKKTSIVELVISDENEALTIDAISLVTSPAIEQDFVYFSKEKNNLTFAKVDEEKRELISPALIPNKQIFRYDPNTDSEYYVYFSKETVKKASHLYLKHNNHHKATEQHTDRVSGVLTVESWIKEGEQDKSNLYGFDLPIGSWFVKMKIENDEVWSKIKSGELKGLSIEGYFTNKFEQMNKKEFTTEEVKTALKELLSVQKVELGAIDDFKKLFEKSLDNWEGTSNSLIKAMSKTQQDYKAQKGKWEQVIKMGESIEKDAKDLGVEIPKTVLGNKLLSAKDFIKESQKINQAIEKLYNIF